MHRLVSLLPLEPLLLLLLLYEVNPPSHAADASQCYGVMLEDRTA